MVDQRARWFIGGFTGLYYQSVVELDGLAGGPLKSEHLITRIFLLAWRVFLPPSEQLRRNISQPATRRRTRLRTFAEGRAVHAHTRSINGVG